MPMKSSPQRGLPPALSVCVKGAAMLIDLMPVANPLRTRNAHGLSIGFEPSTDHARSAFPAVPPQLS